MKRYQLVRDVSGDRKWENLTFSAETFLTEFGTRGYTPNGKVGGDHLRSELIGEPQFKGLFGPTWGGFDGDIPVVRYETWNVADALSS